MDRPPCRRPSGVRRRADIVRIRMTADRRPPADRPDRSAQARRRHRRVPGSLADVEHRRVRQRLRRGGHAAGGLPVHLPQHVDPASYVGRLDGMLLSGGADVDPGALRRRRPTDTDPPEPSATPPSWRSSRWPSPTTCPCSASAAGCSCSTSGPAGRCTRTCRRTPATTLAVDDAFDERDGRARHAARPSVRRDAPTSTRCTTRPSTASPTAGSSRPAAATARSRRWSGRATT